MTDDEVRSVADIILRDKLGQFGFDASQVTSGRDHDGDPALFIVAGFKPGSGPVPGKASNEALGALSDALLAKGEERFPYLSHRYPDDERPEDGSPAASSALL